MSISVDNIHHHQAIAILKSNLPKTSAPLYIGNYFRVIGNYMNVPYQGCLRNVKYNGQSGNFTGLSGEVYPGFCPK